MKTFLAAAFISAAFAASALAQPAQGSVSLSSVLSSIENDARFGYFDEIDWDNDGYWEIVYYQDDGIRVELQIDQMTGEIRR